MLTLPLVHDERAKCAPCQHWRRGGDRFGVGRVDGRSQLIKKVVFVAKHVGLMIKQHRDVAVTDVVEQRKQLVAHSVADKGGVTVRGIVHDGEIERVAQRLGIGAAQSDDRMTGSVAQR